MLSITILVKVLVEIYLDSSHSTVLIIFAYSCCIKRPLNDVHKQYYLNR